jgi:DNA-binding Lrp family transcriptional regulator
MNPALDSTDIKILECLGIYGPRNITEVARKLGMHCETVRKRVKRLISQFFLDFPGNVYHTNLGLKKAFIFADAIPGFEDILFQCLKANDFWIYVGRYYGRYEGCYAIYTVPKEHVADFEEFTNQLERIGVARNVRLYWSTCLHIVNVTENWFDPETKTWIFPWDKWIEEIPTKETNLPDTLIDPKDFPLKADKIDILILAKLEVNSTITLREIAQILNITPEAVSYHYKNHILKRGLFEKSQVFFLRFDKAFSDFFVFIFRFDEKKTMARFALSLLDKPFVYALGKIIGENALISHIYLPKEEFRRFIHALSGLVRRGLLQTYEYVIEDFEIRAAQTISYEYFKDGAWIYNHKKHIENLQNLVKNAKTLVSDPIKK